MIRHLFSVVLTAFLWLSMPLHAQENQVVEVVEAVHSLQWEEGRAPVGYWGIQDGYWLDEIPWGVFETPWPEADDALLARETLILGIQVNGKRRGEIEIAADAEKKAVEDAALSQEAVKRHIEGKTIRKIVIVPGRVVNIVAA